MHFLSRSWHVTSCATFCLLHRGGQTPVCPWLWQLCLTFPTSCTIAFPVLVQPSSQRKTPVSASDQGLQDGQTGAWLVALTPWVWGPRPCLTQCSSTKERSW